MDWNLLQLGLYIVQSLSKVNKTNFQHCKLINLDTVIKWNLHYFLSQTVRHFFLLLLTTMALFRTWPDFGTSTVFNSCIKEKQVDLSRAKLATNQCLFCILHWVKEVLLFLSFVCLFLQISRLSKEKRDMII